MAEVAIGVEAAVDLALRRAFSEASVRLQPDTLISDLIKALGTLHVRCDIEDGLLILKQDDTELHTHKALRSFSQRPEFQKFFIIETDDPKTWTQERKLKYIREHGDLAYGKLCASPVLEAGIRTLDPNMSKTDYLNLTTKERVLFIRTYGDKAVSAIMRKAK